MIMAGIFPKSLLNNKQIILLSWQSILLVGETGIPEQNLDLTGKNKA